LGAPCPLSQLHQLTPEHAARSAFCALAGRIGNLGIACGQNSAAPILGYHWPVRSSGRTQLGQALVPPCEPFTPDPGGFTTP